MNIVRDKDKENDREIGRKKQRNRKRKRKMDIKKKFKKHTVLLTLLSMFFSQCVVIVCDVVALTQLPWGDQLGWMMADSLCVSIFLLVVEFIEVVKIDKIMRTVNTSGHNARKSAAAVESSESDGLSSDGESEDDDYPDWRLMLKNVEGNT